MVSTPTLLFPLRNEMCALFQLRALGLTFIVWPFLTAEAIKTENTCSKSHNRRERLAGICETGKALMPVPGDWESIKDTWEKGSVAKPALRPLSSGIFPPLSWGPSRLPRSSGTNCPIISCFFKTSQRDFQLEQRGLNKVTGFLPYRSVF